MTNNSNGCEKYFEDFEVGATFHFQVPGVSEEEIKAFAQRYDPQRFHLDEQEAAATHFGRLVASGFQTQLLCFQPFCREVLLDSWAVGSPGIDSLKWLRPWYPDEPLSITVTVVDKRLSASRRDRGYMSFRLEAEADGVPTLLMEWQVIMLTRRGAEDGGDSEEHSSI